MTDGRVALAIEEPFEGNEHCCYQERKGAFAKQGREVVVGVVVGSRGRSRTRREDQLDADEVAGTILR